ncbi:MAG: hypothetical protein O2931_12710 [Planctomycetota bacterium]|nr:hypothetical protein [Planctomycetota bacterium]MDA1179646.1 hypothetical protein [Planctomycetota bacterium]
MQANSQLIAGHSAVGQPTLGYLSVHEDGATGAVGGLLLLNVYGRPLELHCSVPVRVNRAQSLLYGDSLRSQLYGHTIAVALWQAAEIRPSFLLTDNLDMLAFRSLSDVALAYLSGSSADGTGLSATAAEPADELAGCRCLAAPGYRDDIVTIRTLWTELGPSVEIMEPFQRLREALREMMVPAVGPNAQAA